MSFCNAATVSLNDLISGGCSKDRSLVASSLTLIFSSLGGSCVGLLLFFIYFIFLMFFFVIFVKIFNFFLFFF